MYAVHLTYTDRIAQTPSSLVLLSSSTYTHNVPAQPPISVGPRITFLHKPMHSIIIYGAPAHNGATRIRLIRGATLLTCGHTTKPIERARAPRAGIALGCRWGFCTPRCTCCMLLFAHCTVCVCSCASMIDIIGVEESAGVWKRVVASQNRMCTNTRPRIHRLCECVCVQYDAIVWLGALWVGIILCRCLL